MICDRSRYAMGWLPDYPDFRDYTQETEEIRNILEPTGLPASKPGKDKIFPLISTLIIDIICLMESYNEVDN